MSDRLKAYERERSARLRLLALVCPERITPANYEKTYKVIVDAIYELSNASRAAGQIAYEFKQRRSSRRR